MKDKYPILVRRFVAMMVDVCVALSLAVILGRFLDSNDLLQSLPDRWIVIFAFVIYEPLFTRYAVTAGQLLLHFRVRRADEKTRITINQGLIRLIIKYCLGWVSLLIVPARKDRRAIHDLWSRTIVVEA